MTLLREDREKRFSGDDGIPINKGVFTPTHDFQVAPEPNVQVSKHSAQAISPLLVMCLMMAELM